MSSRRQRGLSLIEVVIFIVVLGVAFAGMLILYNQVTKASVDPMIRKQALALASSLLEEIELQAYTICDPDDPAVYTATVIGDCATGEVLGAEGAESRYSSVARFDNVSDYNNFRMGSGEPIADADIKTVDGTTIGALANYHVAVTIAQIDSNELGAEIPTGEALRIRVVATHVPTGIQVVLQGYRARYAPKSP